MAEVFHRGRGGRVTARFSADEAELLRRVLGDLRELLSSDAEEDDADPLAAAVGIGTATTAPEDPALARLFPDGYRDDADSAADFRRYTEPGLRAGKLASIDTALATLDAPDEKRSLTKDECHAWLRALTDVRLVLGERLGITEDWDERLDELSQDDPVLLTYWLYDRLTVWQEYLVRALT